MLDQRIDRLLLRHLGQGREGGFARLGRGLVKDGFQGWNRLHGLERFQLRGRGCLTLLVAAFQIGPQPRENWLPMLQRGFGPLGLMLQDVGRGGRHQLAAITDQTHFVDDITLLIFRWPTIERGGQVHFFLILQSGFFTPASELDLPFGRGARLSAQLAILQKLARPGVLRRGRFHGQPIVADFDFPQLPVGRCISRIQLDSFTQVLVALFNAAFGLVGERLLDQAGGLDRMRRGGCVLFCSVPRIWCWAPWRERRRSMRPRRGRFQPQDCCVKTASCS